MESIAEPEITKFVKYLYRGIKRFGIGRIQSKLSELYTSDRPKVIKERILAEITAVYGISKQDILTSKKRGANTEVKVMAIILIHKHLHITQAEIAAMFGCGVSNIGRRIKTFNGINGTGAPLNASDNSFAKIYENKAFMERFRDIDCKVKEFTGSCQSK